MADQSLPLYGADPVPAVTWASVFKIWWLMTWRATVGSIATGVTGGIIIAVVGMLLGWPPLLRTVVIFALCTVIAVIWRIAAVRMALEKRYSDFRLTFSRLP